MGGDDTLDGGAGNDVLDGGGGDDVLVYDAADGSINGGAGSDVLRLSDGGLDLTLVSDAVIQGIEVIDLAGGNAIALALSDVLAIAPEGGTLRIDGDGGDTFDIVDFGENWTQESDQAIGSEMYRVFTGGGATLLVDTDVVNVFAL